MMKNYDNGGHYAMPCHQDILHSYRILSFIGGHHYSCMSFNKRLSIYYVIRDGGGGLKDLLQYYMGGESPQFITILQRGGGLENLLQYYSFERKMESYNHFSALNK